MHTGPIRTDLFNGTLDSYQQAAQLTAIYPGKGTFWGLMYASLKDCGETGEFAEKIGKLMRDDGVLPTHNHTDIPVAKYNALLLELGDELWYLAAKCQELGTTLEQVAVLNLLKLKDRQERGTLSGSGDAR